MFPEESITAALDAKIQLGMPYHWAGFKLAVHDWIEPAEQFLTYAESKGLTYTLPKLGALYTLKSPILTQKWWTDFL